MTKFLLSSLPINLKWSFISAQKLSRRLFLAGLLIMLGSGFIGNAQQKPGDLKKTQVSSIVGKLVRTTPRLADIDRTTMYGEPLKITRDMTGIIGHDIEEAEEEVEEGIRESSNVRVTEGVQKTGEIYPNIPISTLGVSISGQSWSGFDPSDNNMAAGPNHVIQIINDNAGSKLQIWNKAGAVVQAPITLASITGFSGAGDPIVLYDQLADRWFLSEFGPSSCCNQLIIAVSVTANPTGAWKIYQYIDNSFFPDYPKYSVWHNAYYATTNDFNAAGTAYLGSSVYAFDRTAMLAGAATATEIRFRQTGSGNPFYNMGTVCLEGTVPSTQNGLFIYPVNSTNLGIFELTPDFVTPANSVVGSVTLMPVTAFAQPPGSITQQGSSTTIGTLGSRMLFRMNFRNRGGQETIVATHTVGASGGGQASVRWYEFRRSGGTSGPWSVFQQGTLANPDGNSRWMGGISMDDNGTIGLMYDLAGPTAFPSIKFTGRNLTDPLNTMTLAEQTVINGTVAHTIADRWGDYNTLVSDPSTPGDFWGTSQYNNNSTRVFKFSLSIGAPVPVITAGTATITAESCAPNNGVIDPAETVTVSFCLQNVGTLNTANLVGTLLPTGGVTAPSAPQSYGVVTAGGAPVCKSFTFTATGTCGGNLIASIQLMDGATSFGTLTYNFTLGTLTTTFTQNFDAVVAPALPASWVATNAVGAAPLWVTATGTAVSAPNSIFVANPASVSDKIIETPTIAITTAMTQLTFSNNFIFEDGNFDGGVLEISINGGAYVDIITAGGSWVVGGYTGTISSSFGNPLAGRSAWTNSSGGYITTTVNLPAAAVGQNVKFRFRIGSDSSVSATGWNIDNVSVSAPTCCTVSALAPTVTINQAVGQSDPTFTSPINFTIVFSEPVTGFTASGVTLSGTAGATTKVVTGAGPTYNVAVSGMVTSGTVIATIPANVATGTINVVGNTPSTSIDNTVTYNSTGGPVTVTATAGTPGPTPYATVKDAFDAINAGTHQGAVIVNVNANTDEGVNPAVLNSSGTGSSSYTSLLLRPTVDGLTVSGTATPANRGVIELNGADNVTIDGDNPNSAGTNRNLTIGVTTAGAVGIWLKTPSAADACLNNTIKNSVITGQGAAVSLAGILAGSNAFGSAALAPNSNNTIQNNLIKKVQNGLYQNGFGTSPFDVNWQVLGNTMGSSIAADKLAFRGMILINASGYLVNNNTIMGVSSSTTTSATMTGIQIGTGNLNGTISNNTISDIKHNNPTGWGSNGIYLAGTTTASNTNVFNNFISDIASQGFTGRTVSDNGYGIAITSGGGYNIYYNTVLMNTNQVNDGYPSALLVNTVSTNNTLNIRNNIFANTQTVGTERYSVQSVATAARYLDINYNDYSTTGPNLGYLGSNLANLAAWQTATGKDANSISVSPVFLSATNLHLNNVAANAPLDGTATPIAGITADIDGDVRNVTTPDMGADEFSVCPTLSVNPVSNQVLCNGGATTAVIFTGVEPATVYTWTNNTPSIGLLASGTGNIASFTATNTGTAPVTATITVTPTFAGCPNGPSITFTITVNPTPLAVATPSSQTMCNGTSIAPIVLTSGVAGTTFAWTRDNNATVTGIAASGSGTPITGTLTNTTNAPVTVTFTITSTANGCPGAPITATVIVAPTPTVNQPANQTVCNGTMTAPVLFTSPVAGVTYNWTNSNTAIGLGASGTGNIAAFTGTNGTTLPITGTITVTPIFAGGPAVPAPVTFSNTANINLPAGQPGTTSGPAGPYPSPITVSGLPTTGVTVQSITLNNISHSWSSDIDVLLVSPTGQQFMAMSRVGGSTGFDAAATITLKDGSPAMPTTSTAIPTGTYGPTAGVGTTTMPAGAPVGPYNLAAPAGTSTFANVFNSTTNYNGTWNLYIADHTGGDFGSISSGWSITLLSTTPGSCAGPSKTFDITVNPTPTITCPANITTASDVGACNKTVNYTPTVTGTPAPTLSYVLTGATTGSGAGSGSGLKFNVGVTTVTITATNTCATVTCSFTITVTDSQLPTITTQPANRTVCAGSNATFTVVAVTAPSASGPIAYQWQLWNGSTWNNITGATAATLTLNSVTQSMNTNSYRVQVIGLCTTVTSGFATLYVNPLPTINLTTSIPPALLPTQVLTITATTAPSGGSYVWFKNGVVIPGATGNTLSGLTVSDIGTYRVVYTDGNGCVATSANIDVTGQASDNLYVYPVPNQGVFNVRFYNQANEQVTVRVFDAKGAEVYSRKVLTTIPYTTINVDLSTNHPLANGTYVVDVRGADGRLVGSRKIIVYNK